MHAHHLDAVLAAASPFDDVFADDLLLHGDVVSPFPVWTQCGRRIDLQARMHGWRALSLWRVVEDAEATFSGFDDDAWEGSREAHCSAEAWINWRAMRRGQRDPA